MDTSGWSKFHQQAPRKSVAVGALVTEGQRVLMVRHNYGRMKGKWSIPTGFAEPEEAPDVGAVREVKEEAGVIAAAEGLFTLCTVNWENDIQLYLVWLCRHVAGTPVPDMVETNGAQFFTLDDLKSFTEPVIPLSRWLTHRVLTGEYNLLRPVPLSFNEPILGVPFA